MTDLAIVWGSPPGRLSAQTLDRWLREVGIDPGSCAYLTLTEGGNPSESTVRAAVERVRGELAAIPGLRAVVAVGRFGVRLDNELWRGGILKCHGHSGRLWGTYNAIALYDPYNYIKHVKDGNTRRAIEIEASCKLVLSRVTHMDEPVLMPDVDERPRVTVSGLVGLDTETTQDDNLRRLITRNAVDPRASRLKMVGLSDRQLSFNGADFAPDAEPIAWNMPFDGIVTGDPKRGWRRPDGSWSWNVAWHDGKVLAHLLGEKDTELKSLALRWIGRPMMHYDEAGGTDREPSYCVADSMTHRDLYLEGRKRATPGILSVYDNIERPSLRLYARWSMQGVFQLDRAGAQALYDRQLAEIEQLERRVRDLTGIDNVNSTEQVAAHVFGWRKESGRAKPSVAESVLAEHVHVRGVPEILKVRELRKQANTYLGAWLKWPFERIGCLWKPTGAWTGRPSVNALQLHNVPPDLRGFLGPDPDHVLWSFDNSQLEIRTAAHISRDENMIRLLRGEIPGYEDGDIHRWATDLLSKAVGHPLSRTFGKIGNFSTLYGGSEAAIYSQAPRFGVTMDEIRPVARHINQLLPRMFPGFFAWKRKVESLPRVPGLFGAVLIPPPHPDESYLQRERVNAPIQRGAVDVVKLQALALDAAGFDTCHEIHDEVIIRLHKRDATPENRAQIERIMANAVRLDVPIVVGWKEWGAAHE